MGMLDGLLGNVDGIAAKLGLPADQAKSLVEGLQAKIGAGGDPMSAISDLAQQHGLSVDSLKSMLGGEGNPLGNLMSGLDKDGDGNPLNDLAGMAKGLFGKS